LSTTDIAAVTVVAEISNRGDLFRGVPRREATYNVARLCLTQPHGQIARIFELAKRYNSILIFTSISISIHPGCIPMKSAGRPINMGRPRRDRSCQQAVGARRLLAAIRRAACPEMVTTFSACLMNLHDYGIAVGNPADFACPRFEPINRIALHS
jgi:hypothetical protein